MNEEHDALIFKINYVTMGYDALCADHKWWYDEHNKKNMPKKSKEQKKGNDKEPADEEGKDEDKDEDADEEGGE